MPYFEDPRMDRVWQVGERGFTHYDMEWGTVLTEPDDQGWFYVRYDREGHGRTLLNAERFVTEQLAKGYGYGSDPAPGQRCQVCCDRLAELRCGATDASDETLRCARCAESSGGSVEAL